MSDIQDTKVKDLIVKTEALLDNSDAFMQITTRGFDSNSLMQFKTFNDKKIAAIAERMPEINRATNSFGRKNSQTMGKMMSLNMISFSPYSRMKQCLAQIENKRSALKENIFKLRENKIKLERDVYERDSLKSRLDQSDDTEEKMNLKFDIDLLEVEIQRKASSISDTTLYIEGCLKEIGMYQKTYEEIRVNNDIPEKWDEADFERGELEHHIKTAFLHLVRDIQQTGRINVGTSEYLEQFGVNPQTAIDMVKKYLNQIDTFNSGEAFASIDTLYNFLDKMYNIFKEEYKKVLAEMGIDTLVHDEFLYLEDKDV